MSWFSDFMHPGKGYDDAMQQYQQYFNQGMGYQQPFQQAGQQSIPQLQQMLGALGDPAKLESEWSQGYEKSPYAQSLMRQSAESGMDAAAAQGLSGSSAAVGGIQQQASDIMSRDRQQYLNDLMQKYLGGVQGLQGMFNTGAGVAGQMGQQSMNMGQNMGQAAYGKQQAGANMFGGILSGVGELGMNYLTGGMGKGSFGRGAWS